MQSNSPIDVPILVLGYATSCGRGCPEVGVTLRSRGTRRPHQILTRGRQNTGVPETGRPRAACGEDGGVWAKKGREPGLPGTPGGTSPARTGVLGLPSPEL